MDRAEVIRLNEGNHIQVDLGDVGYRIDGPATVVVIKKETAAKATESGYVGN